MSRRKTNTKEVLNNIEDEITSKELMYAVMILLIISACNLDIQR